jgi:glyoxylase-like metal-dependent hydrolase (beta-lactamase superfamily II)
MHLGIFTFNPFQENTYILYDETGECVILDPGCINSKEEKQLDDFIEANGLKPVRLINTHCHIDHILGNKYVSDKYDLGLEIHEGEMVVLRSGKIVGDSYGIPYNPSPEPVRFIKDGDIIEFGNTKLESIFTPGHSPASLSFLNRESNILIAGDVLFRESIGRTDLPGGSMSTLISSIQNRLLILDDDTQVFPGHGPKTTIGHERVNNPFLRELIS